MATATVPIDGIDYSTLYEGPKGAPCVLLCHALMSNLHMWDSAVKALHGAGYSTLRYDHVGHNNTPAPSDSARQRHMDDLVKHMHHMVEVVTGQAEVKAVIGCSIGGAMALRYAMLFPDDVDYAISLCAPGMTSLAAAKPLWSQRIQQFEQDQRDGTDTLRHATVNRWLPGDTEHDEAVRAEALTHVKTCSLQGYTVLADTIRDYDYTGQLGELKGVKCLVVAGGRDGAVQPDVLRDVASKIDGAEFVMMENAGHIPPMHRSAEFEELILSFLSSSKANL